VKLGVVEEGNYLKFSQNTGLRRKLLATGDAELVEAARGDRVWGIGFSVEDAPRTPRARWGQNLLGKALVNVRERLRREDAEHAQAKTGSEGAYDEPADGKVELGHVSEADAAPAEALL
jgi:hypothetical protein